MHHAVIFVTENLCFGKIFHSTKAALLAKTASFYPTRYCAAKESDFNNPCIYKPMYKLFQHYNIHNIFSDIVIFCIYNLGQTFLRFYILFMPLLGWSFINANYYSSIHYKHNQYHIFYQLKNISNIVLSS